MTPSARRIIIPLVVGLVAIGIALTMLLRPKVSPSGPSTSPSPTVQNGQPPETPEGEPTEEGSAVGADLAADIKGTPLPDDILKSLHVKEIEPRQAPMLPLGDLDPENGVMLVEFSQRAAGIERITFSNFWTTATAKRQAEQHRKDVAENVSNPTPIPDDSLRYVLQTAQQFQNSRLESLIPGGGTLPLFAAHHIDINGRSINLFSSNWEQYAPGKFLLEIVDGDDNVIVRVHRKYGRVPGKYVINLTQQVENNSPYEYTARLVHYGPSDLNRDLDAYADLRRIRFGYLLGPQRDPSGTSIRADSFVHDHQTLVSSYDHDDSNAELSDAQREVRRRLWPNPESIDQQYQLSWFGSTGRYFALGMMPGVTRRGVGRTLGEVVESVQYQVTHLNQKDALVLTLVQTPEHRLVPGTPISVANYQGAIFAGPLDRRMLSTEEPYATLQLEELVLFLMGSCFCNTFCTFPWLAHFLVAFLGFLHDYILFDWGLAIIALVVVVRTLLHPLTKRSQISIARFSKMMSTLKPEMDRLQERYKNDPASLQRETMALYREKGVNPVGCLGGFLPMFLQTPIWIALYATLYFAFELRHEPAFFGLFQKIGGWPFLGDLSASDHFFWHFQQPHSFWIWTFTGINLIPILMGVIFFIQQKYMTPPTATPLTPEQQSQQKIMKVMTVVLFPVMLYTAPSGLTLYIFTSSVIGVIESRYIRRHISEMELNPPKPKEKKKSDRMGRMYAEALERARQKSQKSKTFKERD